MDTLLLIAGFIMGFISACILYDDKLNPKDNQSPKNK